MSGGATPNIYQYQGSGVADAGALSGVGNLGTAALGSEGLYNNSLPSLEPLANGTNYQSQQGVNAGNNIQGSVAGLPGYANEALSTGFNANNGLYNQELGQITDQTRAGEAARGIAMTPYGAGVEGQTLTNFNNTWNNQQLQNEATGAQTAGSLLGTYNSGQAEGAQVAQGAADNSLSSLSSLLGSSNASTGQLQQSIGDYLSYLTGGTSAGSAQASATNAANQTANQGLAGFGNLGGTALGALTGK